MSRNGNTSTQWEETEALGRAAIMKEALWFDGKGNRMPVKYTFVADGIPDWFKDWTKKTLQTWSSKTCLTFQKREGPKDEDKFKAWCYEDKVPVDEKIVVFEKFDIRFDKFGIPPSKGDRCTQYGINRHPRMGTNDATVGRILGLVAVLLRPDRDEFMSWNWEWVRSELSPIKYWFKCFGKTHKVPLPSDFLSILNWPSFDFGDTVESIPTQATRDPSQQYLIDFKDYQQPHISPLDLHTINIIYKCIPEWESACRTNGKEVPKCKNFGYVTKECVCLCLPVYSGKLCENKIDTNFPYPMQVGAFNYTINSRGEYDLGKLLPLSAPYTEELNPCIFIIVKLEPRGKAVLPFVSVRSKIRDWTKLVRDDKMHSVDQWDCLNGVRILWGSQNRDGQRRLACECISSIGFNEPKENARVLSSRAENMTLTFVSRFALGFGNGYNEQKIAVESVQHILEVRFRNPPAFINKHNRSDEVGIGGNATGGDAAGGSVTNSTETSLTATAAAMTAVGGAGGMATMIGAIAALTLLCLLCLLLMKRRKKKKANELGEEEEEEEEENSEGSASGSD